ncbi:MAG: LPXTG cell wall anchor domain-containing protein [Lachnospiraceae bacterium]|nr:LPXTG cell wall anchor domain-containing protein [Lachnospiraceae bacterium]
MNKYKKILALFMVAVMSVVTFGQTGMTALAATTDTDANEEISLYDKDVRTDLDEDEVAKAEDINVIVDSDFDVTNVKDGISYDDTKVSVAYVENMGDFNLSKAGKYDTYYLVEPYSGKAAYLIHRAVTVDEPEATDTPKNEGTREEDEGDSDEDPDPIVGDERNPEELPLSEGELENIQSSTATFSIILDDDQDAEFIEEGINPETGDTDKDLKDDESDDVSLLDKVGNLFSKAVDVVFPSVTAYAAENKNKMKVSYSGYAGYCGHRTGIKYISEEGDYYKHLVYCMDMKKNTTNGTVSAGGKIKAQITFCLVNGARTLGGKCHTSKYSSNSAAADYFITSAAIHVLNGEVKLSYYNDGSGVYKNIEQMVNDAKKLDKSKYNLETGLTKSITYTISPKQTAWKDMGDGLYRSEEKFVRSKSGTITDVKYQIKGAPSGLTVGEIKTDSSNIDDENDLKKYDICVAQTDASKASSNFYLYCNSDAMEKIIADKSTIKVVAKAYSDEKGGRKWTPTVVSQQKITFLEEFNTLSAKATVKVTSDFKLGSISIRKFDKYTKAHIDGATYYMYEDKDCEEFLCELKGTGDGCYASEVETLTQDKYYLVEVEAPDGFALDETVHEVDISYFTIYDAKGNVVQQGKEFSHEEEPERVGVMIGKKDSFTGNEIKTAGFAVFNDAACTKRTIIDSANENVEVPVFHYDEDLGAAVSVGFVKTQDTYYVKEVEIPDGYSGLNTIWEVQPGYGETVYKDVTNTPIRCDVTAKKKQKKEGLMGDATLIGATYGLYAAEDIKYPDGTGVVTYKSDDPIKASKGTDFKFSDVTATKDTLLATIKTDGDTEFSFSNLYFGNYYIKEIEPSVGCILDDTVYELKFREAKDTHSDISLNRDVFEDVKKQAFEIIKVSTDGDTGETDKVKDAEFTVKLKSEINKKGWDEATTYDTLVTDEKGYAKSVELPYGEYLVKETKVPKDLYKTDDFTVKVTEDSRTPQVWRTLNDAPFKAYIRIVKKDAESGETVLLPGVTFKIRKGHSKVDIESSSDASAKAEEKDNSSYVEQKVGDKKITEFTTDDTGTVTTPLKLKYGDYEIVEIKAPDGYLITNEPKPFSVTKEGAVQVTEDDDGDPVITVDIENKPVKGSVSIKKSGEVLVAAEYDTIIDRILTAVTGDNRSVRFKYEEQPLAGAKYELVADEDIYTPDHQKDASGDGRKIAVYNDIPVVSGAAVATLVTDDKGEASADGLPLGKYHLVEVEAPHGYVLDETAKEIELTYKDDHTEVVYENAEFVDERVKTELSIIKKNSVSEIPVEGATYGVYATEDILGRDDKVLVEADSLIQSAVTDEEGKAVFDSDLPLGKYYVKEVETAPGYLVDENEYEVDFTYQDPKIALLTKEIPVEETPIIVEISKSDITTGKELPGAKLEIIDKNGETFAAWTSNGEPYTINPIPAGEYTLRETTAPYGYQIAEEVKFTVEETGEIQKVAMSDERVLGMIHIYKTDGSSKKPLAGAEFEVRNEKGTVIAKLTSGKDGKAVTEPIPIGSYKEDGTFDKDLHYFVVETKAPDGYILDDTKHDIVLQYDDDPPEFVEYTLNVKNKPNKPRLPQTGGNFNPWLFAGAGTGILIGAAIWYIRRRRKFPKATK